MKEALQQWLAGNTLLPGVQACSVQFLDRIYLNHAFGELVKPDRLNQVWNTVADLLPELQAQRIPPPTPLLWSFDGGGIAFRHPAGWSGPGTIHRAVGGGIEGDAASDRRVPDARNRHMKCIAKTTFTAGCPGLVNGKPEPPA